MMFVVQVSAVLLLLFFFFSFFFFAFFRSLSPFFSSSFFVPFLLPLHLLLPQLLDWFQASYILMAAVSRLTSFAAAEGGSGFFICSMTKG